MSRILMTWELGSNLGHITPLLILARALRQRGHAIVFALNDIRGCAQLLNQQQFPFLQSPVSSGRSPGITGNPASYPEILLREGFGDPQTLIAVAHAWRNLYQMVKPDAIIFDHSPAALLAARGTGLPRILFGTGFGSPPRISPMPSFRPWQQISMQQLEASEHRALATANLALNAIQTGPLAAVYQLFEVEEDLLATFPELDHYRSRSGAHYWGPLYDAGGGEDVHWPATEGKKLFIYVRPNSPAFEPLAELIRRANLPTLWFAPGLPSQTVEKLQTDAIRFLLNPLDIAQIAASADAAILHAGHGTTVAMLLGGIPILLIPDNLEQFLVARNAAALGVAAVVPPTALQADLEPIVTRFLNNESHRTRAREFAEKYKDFDQGKQLAAMVDRIEELSGAGSLSTLHTNRR